MPLTIIYVTEEWLDVAQATQPQSLAFFYISRIQTIAQYFLRLIHEQKQDSRYGKSPRKGFHLNPGRQPGQIDLKKMYLEIF